MAQTNGRARLDDGKVRVAIVGVGNCANSLLQGVEYYKDAPDDQFVPGLMHVNLGGYHVRDVEFTAAFDVVKGKVGEDLADAVCRRVDEGAEWRRLASHTGQRAVEDVEQRADDEDAGSEPIDEQLARPVFEGD